MGLSQSSCPKNVTIWASRKAPKHLKLQEEPLKQDLKLLKFTNPLDLIPPSRFQISKTLKNI